MSDNNPNTQGAVSITVVPNKNAKNKSKGKGKSKKMPRNNSQTLTGSEKRAVDRILSAVHQSNNKGNMPKNIASLPSAMPSNRDGYTECLGMFVPKRLVYLAALLAPREFEGCRVPDPWTRDETATYQAKKTFDITGVFGTNVLPNDLGRFSFIMNPVISETVAWSNSEAGWQLAKIDGDGTGPWDGVYAAPNAGVNHTTYEYDQYQSSWVGTSGEAMMLRCRPVSASVLVSYNGQLINGGGNIAMRVAPANTYETNLTTIPSISMANWENLSAAKQAYDGPLVRGAYGIWLPENETDYLLYDPRFPTNDPNSMGNHDYPQIVCSGKITGVSQTGSGVGPSLRVDIYINYEYTTNSRQVEAEHGPDDPAMRVRAMRALKKASVAMENDGHIDWIKTILAGAAGFIAGGPVGAVLAAASVATGTSILGLKSGK